jgi:4-carboxymuconolactone decarboxylase
VGEENKDSFQLGLELRRDMFGRSGADDAVESAGSFTAPMQDFVTRYCFGEVWQRPSLDRRTRSLLTLAILATLGRPNQFRLHVRGAIANGATSEDIREVLLHTMVYAGVPSAVDCMVVATEILGDPKDGVKP